MFSKLFVVVLFCACAVSAQMEGVFRVPAEARKKMRAARQARRALQRRAASPVVDPGVQIVYSQTYICSIAPADAESSDGGESSSPQLPLRGSIYAGANGTNEAYETTGYAVCNYPEVSCYWYPDGTLDTVASEGNDCTGYSVTTATDPTLMFTRCPSTANGEPVIVGLDNGQDSYVTLGGTLTTTGTSTLHCTYPTPTGHYLTCNYLLSNGTITGGINTGNEDSFDDPEQAVMDGCALTSIVPINPDEYLEEYDTTDG